MDFSFSCLILTMIVSMSGHENVHKGKCKGKSLSGICNIIEGMKKDIHSSHTQMKKQFKEIKTMLVNLTQQSEEKTNLEKEMELLLKVQASGIKMVTKDMAKRLDTFSETMKAIIKKGRYDLTVEVNELIEASSQDIQNLKDELILQFKINKIIYENGMKHLHDIIDSKINDTNHMLNVHRLTIENDFKINRVNVRGEFIDEIATVARQYKHQVKETHVQLEKLDKITEKKSIQKWPKGSYCILANGECPKGSKSISGHLRAISMYSPSSDYIKEAVFGSSSLTCYGKCGDYGEYIGDLFLTTCCW